MPGTASRVTQHVGLNGHGRLCTSPDGRWYRCCWWLTICTAARTSDSRRLGQFARLPVLEPATVQEC